VCIQSSGIILAIIIILGYLCDKFAASNAKLTHEEKLRTQSLTQSRSLFDAPGTEALPLQKSKNTT